MVRNARSRSDHRLWRVYFSPVHDVMAVGVDVHKVRDGGAILQLNPAPVVKEDM